MLGVALELNVAQKHFTCGTCGKRHKVQTKTSYIKNERDKKVAQRDDN